MYTCYCNLRLHMHCVPSTVGWLVGFMVFNATFNNFSVILWRLILLMKDLGSISQKVVSLRSVVSVNFNQSKAWKSHLRLILDLRFFVKSTPGENHIPTASHWQLNHIMLYTSPWSRVEPTTSVVIGTNSIGNCKSNYHTSFL